MKVTVNYWQGAVQLKEVVATYAEAMEVASRNQNAYPPTFYAEDGRKLFDAGNGLVYEDSLESGKWVYAV